ncbi:Wzz/FepE/Etk N-terminal domain-containing protein [Edwardsiella tarda]|uniref:Wzz/FepE/Etk N-terminal domain-containing protein n=1 Tax=Edwardsiella tarda TaxID=636 RepID=UPI00351BF4ED
MHTSSANTTNDELDLIEILNQLWYGKRIIIGLSLFSVLIASTYLMLLTPKWIVEITLAKPYLNQLANYPSGVTLTQLRLTGLSAEEGEDSATINEDKITNDVFNTFIAVANENPEQQPFTLKSGAPRGGLVLSYSGTNAQLAEDSLQSILSTLNILTQQRLYAALHSTLQERENILKIQIKAQEDNAKAQRDYRLSLLKNALQIAQRLDIQHSQITKSSGEISNDILFMLGAPTLQAIIEYENSLPLKFNQSYYKAKGMLDAINYFKLQPEHFYSFSSSPSEVIRGGPKRTLILALALLLGIITSCAYILLHNALREHACKK